MSEYKREYEIYYRQRYNKNAEEFCCTVTCDNKKEARQNFEEWDNINKDYTITRIIRV